MSAIVVAGDTSGSVTLQAPAVAGTTVITLPSTSGTMALSGGAGSFTTVEASSTIKGGSTIGVGGATPSASGAGITFPATQSASTDANTLDDYEEGTWTPIAGSDGGAPSGQSYSVQQGNYRKIGSLVVCTFYITLTTAGTIPAGSYCVRGLPFVTPSNATASGCVNYLQTSNATGAWFTLSVAESSTIAYTNYIATTGTATANANIWKNGTILQGTITYIAA